MRINLDLSVDERMALLRFMAQYGAIDPRDAIKIILRDWMIGQRYLDLLDENAEPNSQG